MLILIDLLNDSCNLKHIYADVLVQLLFEIINHDFFVMFALVHLKEVLLKIVSLSLLRPNIVAWVDDHESNSHVLSVFVEVINDPLLHYERLLIIPL